MLSALIQVLNDATKTKLKFEEKASHVDLVTKIDTEIEHLLISGLKEKFPDHR